MSDWTCPECGFVVDTPNHHLGCEIGREAANEAPAHLLADPVRLARSMAEIDAVDRAAAEDRKREREAKRLAEALKTFRRFGPCPSAFVCASCSALVEDRAAHVRWHDSLNETAAKADHADWASRPIG